MNSLAASALSFPPPTRFPAYARAVQSLPLLAEEDERRLVEEWQDRGDREAARQLVMAHLRLVVKVVREHEGYGLPAGDLAQEGTVGLMRAVHKFLPRKGVRLSSYALPWIEAEVREYILRNWRLVRMATSGWAKKLFFGYRRAMREVDNFGPARPPQIRRQEVAQLLGVTPEQVEQAAGYFEGEDLAIPGSDLDSQSGQHHSVALDAELSNRPVALLSPPASTPEDVAIAEERARLLPVVMSQALATLSCRERTVVEARLLQSPPEGLKELGARLGVSAERVRQIERAASSKLQDHLAPQKDILLLGWNN